MVRSTYPESFRVIAEKLLEEIEFEISEIKVLNFKYFEIQLLRLGTVFF